MYGSLAPLHDLNESPEPGAPEEPSVYGFRNTRNPEIWQRSQLPGVLMLRILRLSQEWPASTYRGRKLAANLDVCEKMALQMGDVINYLEQAAKDGDGGVTASDLDQLRQGVGAVFRLDCYLSFSRPA